MSGGHYPAYNRSQSPQEFSGPRHRLPRIPLSGPTSRYHSTSISPAHGSSSWMNKQNYSSKFIDNTSSCYPRNYSPNISYSGEWAKSSYDKTNTAEAGNNKFSTEEQQESMDLSSHVSTQSSKTSDCTKIPAVNGDTSTKRVEKKTLKNLNGAAMLNRSDTESEVAVSVIKSNPLKSTKSPIRGGTSNESERTPAMSNLQCKTILPKMVAVIGIQSSSFVVPSDNVESVLETMFHSDSKSSAPTSGSIIVPSQLCKVSQESVEKILKSPSPMKTELSPEAALEVLEKSDNENEILSISPCRKKEKSNKQAKSRIVLANSESESTTETAKDADAQINPSGITEKEDALNNRTNVIQTNEQDCSSTSTANEESSKPKQSLTKKSTTSDMSAKINSKDCAGTMKSKIEDTNYVAVESELEKMFAGIVDTEICKSDDPSQSLPNDSHETMPDPCQSSPHITPCEDSMSNYQLPVAELMSFTKKPNKKKSSKKSKSSNSASKNSKAKQSTCVKENSIVDSTTAKRVPVIHIEGSKVNPTSVQIVNSIKLEEEDATDNKLAAKRKMSKSDKANKRLAADYVLKNYDPCTSDASWICIFCKLCAYGPWISGEPSGDLFGPYFIRDPGHAGVENNLMHQSRPDYTDQLHPVKKKQKRSLSVESDYLNSSSSQQKTLEIWAHENCFVWASGVHLVGSKLIGLEEAVWEALKTTCSHCGEKGASIGCKARHCKAFVHYGCAVFTGWNFDLQTFITTCNIHKVPD